MKSRRINKKTETVERVEPQEQQKPQEFKNPEDKIEEMNREMAALDNILASLERVKQKGVFSRFWDWLFGNEKKLKEIVEDEYYKCDLIAQMSGNDVKLVDAALLDFVKKLINARLQYIYLKGDTSYRPRNVIKYGEYPYKEISFDSILKEFRNYQIKGFLKVKHTKLYKFLVANNWTIYEDSESKNYEKGYDNSKFLESRVFVFQPGNHEEKIGNKEC